MTLIKSNFPVLNSLSDFFDDDWLKFRKNDNMPAVNVVDNEGSYEIEVAAPGFKKDEFKINLEGNLLTISGKTEKEKAEEKKNYTRKEFSSMSFSRSFTLPQDAKDEDIQAKYIDGVLKLTINKVVPTPAAKKKIAVK